MDTLVLFLLAGLVVAGAIGALVPRGVCLLLGAIALLCGVALPLAIWAYANAFVAGDPSAYGMLGTLLAVVFAPFGVAITLVGLAKAG